VAPADARYSAETSKRNLSFYQFCKRKQTPCLVPYPSERQPVPSYGLHFLHLNQSHHSVRNHIRPFKLGLSLELDTRAGSSWSRNLNIWTRMCCTILSKSRHSSDIFWSSVILCKSVLSSEAIYLRVSMVCPPLLLRIWRAARF
jgi:hypothetical protein